jgi:DnaK suppressor protein
MLVGDLSSLPLGSQRPAPPDAPDGLAALRRQLEDDLRAATDRLRRIEGVPESLVPDQAGLDVLEEADANATREALFESRERLLARIRSLQAALARLAAGDYGRCTQCGGPIGAARLRALPDATTCVACQARQERAAAPAAPGAYGAVEEADALALLAEATGAGTDEIPPASHVTADVGSTSAVTPEGGDADGPEPPAPRGRAAAPRRPEPAPRRTAGHRPALPKRERRPAPAGPRGRSPRLEGRRRNHAVKEV